MNKAQYLCVKAVHNEVDSLRKDGWRVVVKTSHPYVGLYYYLRHPSAGAISIQTNYDMTMFSLYKNGVLKKCQNFGV